MTLTHPVPATVDFDLKLKALDATTRQAFIPVASTASSDGNRKTADQIYDGGSAADPVKLFSSTQYVPKTDRTTIVEALTTIVRDTDAAGNVDDDWESVSIVFNHGGKAPKSTQFLMDDLMILCGMVMKTLTAANGYPTPAVLDSAARGVLTSITK